MSIAVQTSNRLETGNRRYAPRRALRLQSAVSDSGMEVIIHDLSPTGMLLETSHDLCSGETLFVDLPDRGPTAASVVWSSGQFHGCEFEQSIPTATISAALLRSPAAAPSDTAEPSFDIYDLKTLAAAIEADEPIDDRYSLRTRGLVISGMLVASWGAIGWVVSAFL